MKLDRFINRPVLSTVISILIVILGLIGLATLPITQYPDIAPPTVSVRATYQGANAQTVLNSVIAPLEDQINGVENMMYMTSNASNSGSADISIYFKQGTDPDMAAVNVQNRVSMAQGLLPAEVTKVGVTTQKRQTSMLMVFSIYDETDQYNIEFLENYANINLIPEVKRVSGVRLPKKPPKVLSDRSHDIPTRKKIIPCASSDTQPRTYVCEGKENVRMAKSTKSYEARMLEMEKKEQESLEKAKRYAAQKKELLKRKKAEESKKRTHRLCQIGGAVESVLGAPIEEEDIPKLIGFLKRQEANGKFFSKAMQKEVNTDMEEV